MVFKYATLALMLSATSSYAFLGFWGKQPVTHEEKEPQFGKVIGSPTDAKRLGGHETTMRLLQNNRDALQKKFDAEKARIEDQIEGLEKLSVELKDLIGNYPGVDSNKFAPSQEKFFHSFNTSIEKILKTTSDFNHDSLKGQELLKTQIQLLNAFFAEFKARESELRQLEKQVPEETAKIKSLEETRALQSIPDNSSPPRAKGAAAPMTFDEKQAARMQEISRLNQRAQLLKAMLQMNSNFSGVRESELFKMREGLIANTKKVLTILDGPISQGVLLEIKKLQMILAGKNPEAHLNVLRAQLAEMDKAIELTQKRAELNAGVARDPNGAPLSGSRKPAPVAPPRDPNLDKMDPQAGYNKPLPVPPMVAPNPPQMTAQPQPQWSEASKEFDAKRKALNIAISRARLAGDTAEVERLGKEMRTLMDSYYKKAN